KFVQFPIVPMPQHKSARTSGLGHEVPITDAQRLVPLWATGVKRASERVQSKRRRDDELVFDFLESQRRHEPHIQRLNRPYRRTRVRTGSGQARTVSAVTRSVSSADRNPATMSRTGRTSAGARL